MRPDHQALFRQIDESAFALNLCFESAGASGFNSDIIKRAQAAIRLAVRMVREEAEKVSP